MRKISLDQLYTLFVNGQPPLVLKPEVGQGSLCVVELEEDLQLRSWDCRLDDGIELFTRISNGYEAFHLVFFLHPPGLQIENDNTLEKNSIWDTIFFSSYSTLKIIIPPLAPIQCISMSFSKRWVTHNLALDNQHKRDTLKKLIADRAFCKLECMNPTEKKNVSAFSAMATSDRITSFYIKSTGLKIISDFFLKLIDDSLPNSTVSRKNSKHR